MPATVSSSNTRPTGERCASPACNRSLHSLQELCSERTSSGPLISFGSVQPRRPVSRWDGMP